MVVCVDVSTWCVCVCVLDAGCAGDAGVSVDGLSHRDSSSPDRVVSLSEHGRGRSVRSHSHSLASGHSESHAAQDRSSRTRELATIVADPDTEAVPALVQLMCHALRAEYVGVRCATARSQS